MSAVILLLWRWPPLPRGAAVDRFPPRWKRVPTSPPNVPKIISGVGLSGHRQGSRLLRADDHLGSAASSCSSNVYDEGGLPAGYFHQRSRRATARPRVQGTAVLLTARPDAVPHALLHNLLHNQVLHEQVVLLTVVYEDIPRVPPNQTLRGRVLRRRFLPGDPAFRFHR